MRELVVFGDSFNVPAMGTHWSEILSSRHNLKLTSLARPGCSTRYIIFQIMHALEFCKEDSLIIGSQAASFTRVEMLTKPQNADNYRISMRSFENFDFCANEQTFIKSINLFTIANDESIAEDEKRFLLTKVSAGLLRHTDKWGMFYALTKLKNKNRNFLYLSSIFNDSILFSNEELLENFGTKNVMMPDELSFSDYYIDKQKNKDFIDLGYHTTPESQIEIANKIEHKLKSQGLL